MKAQDLSLHHGMVGATMGPAAVEPRHELSAAQLRQFAEQGFVAGVRVLDDRQVDALLAELEGWMQPEHAGRELWYEYRANASADPARAMLHASGAWRIGRGFHDLLWNPAVVGPARQLLGGGVRFMQDQLFCKPPSRGGVVAWHQDYSYWTRTQPMSHLTCWIGLDDSTVANGCVHYVPGSHRWDLLRITGLAGNMAAIREVLTPEQWDRFQRPVAVELLKGECTFHHPLMVHGSFENRTDQPRRATVINVFRDGVRSESNEPLLQGVPVIPAGQQVTGQFFPLLYARS